MMTGNISDPHCGGASGRSVHSAALIRPEEELLLLLHIHVGLG
jgi:hypothetical protein